MKKKTKERRFPMTPYYVTSLEWSERLKKAGMEQKSEFLWCHQIDNVETGHRGWYINPSDDPVGDIQLPAYLSDELAGMLPAKLSDGRMLQIVKISNGEYWVTYEMPFVIDDSPISKTFLAETLPNALAAMVEYLRKEKII